METLQGADGAAPGIGKRVYRQRPNGEVINSTVTLGMQAEKLWATPMVPNSGRAIPPQDVENRGATEKGKRQIPLEMEARYWPTPFGFQAGNGPDGNEFSKAVRQWPTPRASESEQRTHERPASHDQGHGKALSAEAEQWPTPRVRSTAGDSASPKRLKEGPSPGLNDAAMRWPTPTAQDSESSGNRPGKSGASDGLTKAAKAHPGTSLTDAAARQWSTPRAEDAESCGTHPGSKGGDSLTGQTKNWPTPSTNPQAPNKNSNTVNGPASLEAAALGNWPTPSARDMKGTDRPGHHGGASLSHYVETGQRSHSSPPDPESASSGKPSSPLARTSPLRLNPAFVSWLMGWPWWWTRAERISFAAREMESYRSRQRSLLSSFFQGSISFPP